MNESGSRPERLLDRLFAWARRCLRRSCTAGLEPEDLVQVALVKGIERSVLVRESAGPPSADLHSADLHSADLHSADLPRVAWLRRAMEFELAYQRRRRSPSSRPRRTTPLPWGQVELWGEELDPRSSTKGSRATRERAESDKLQLVHLGLWTERVSLLVHECFTSNWETSSFLLGGRSRDAGRRLLNRARTRVRSGAEG